MSTDDLEQKKIDFVEKLRQLKEDLKNVQTQTQMDTLKGVLASVESLAQELGIPFDANTIEQSMTAKVQAKNVINAIDQMSDQERESEEARKEKEEHAATVIRLAEHYAKYDSNEEELHRLLKKDTDLLKKANNNPESLTSDDHRRLKGENLTPEEQAEEEKKRNHLNILANIIDDTKKHNEYCDKQINQINEQLKKPAPNENVKKSVPNENVRKDLEKEKKDLEQQKTQVNKALNKRLEPIFKQMDEEREELFKFAEKHPNYAEDKIKEHIETYKKEYQVKLENNPDYKELKKLQETVKKIERSEPTTQKTTEQPNKQSKTNDIPAINKPNSTLGEKLSKGEIDGKSAVGEIKKVTDVDTKHFTLTPSPTPGMQRLANKGKGLE